MRTVGGGQVHDSVYFTVTDPDRVPQGISLVAHVGRGGRMRYIPDYRGNHIPDYSTAGYHGHTRSIPLAPVRKTLSPAEGDDTERIQEALDAVGKLPLDENGLRGAVLLRRGVYEISGMLSISESGVVLRGEGRGEPRELWLDPQRGLDLDQAVEDLAGRDATILLSTATEHSRTLLRIGGSGRISADSDSTTEIVDQYVPGRRESSGLE